MIRTGRAAHPPVSEVSATAWLRAFTEASADPGSWDGVQALAAGGQQHGMRALADKHKVHRRTVRVALPDALPPVRKPPVRVAPVLGRYEATIRRWLSEDIAAPRKQRHTARRVWQRLLEEEGVVVAESSVRNLVAQLRVEVGGP